MGSSRLAGKVLQPVAGRPVLWHVVHRLKKCRELDEVRIATTTHSQDDPIIAFAKQEGVPVTRGSEDNVLQRYQLAVDESQADIIIRVTGDAPLIDTTIIDVMLAKMRETGADICGGGGLDADVIHEGFSVVSRRLFDELVRNGGHDPSVREHVIYKFDEYVPDLVPSVITFDPRHFFKGARISVDGFPSIPLPTSRSSTPSTINWRPSPARLTWAMSSTCSSVSQNLCASIPTCAKNWAPNDLTNC